MQAGEDRKHLCEKLVEKCVFVFLFILDSLFKNIIDMKNISFCKSLTREAGGKNMSWDVSKQAGFECLAAGNG